MTERAAEHICFLADVNQLYDTALGLYNLELALLIAQQSQKVNKPTLVQKRRAYHFVGSSRIFTASAISP